MPANVGYLVSISASWLAAISLKASLAEGVPDFV